MRNGMSEILTKCRSAKKLSAASGTCQQQFYSKETNLERIRKLDAETIAQKIAENCDSLMDEICLKLCPAQDCEPEGAEQCVKCVERWLGMEVGDE